MEQKEVDRLVVEMSEVAKSFAKVNPQTLVVLDSAARPLALPMKKILKDAFGQKVRVVFISPSYLKTIHEVYIKGGLRYSPELWGLVKVNLRREFPEFIKAVQGKRVVILDEQKKSGKTFEAMESFVKYLGASGVKSHALSSFPKKPFYSWRNEKVSFTKKAED